MARYTLVYGVRLIPEGSLKDLDDAKVTLADGSTTGVTLHTLDGTIPQLRRSLDRSLDAFFDLSAGSRRRRPGAVRGLTSGRRLRHARGQRSSFTAMP